MLEVSTPEARIKAITSETEKIFRRIISDKIASIRGESSIVPTFELPLNKEALRSKGIDSRVVDLFSEENENGTVEITVFTNEVRIFNIHTLRSMFVSPLRPYLRMDGLVYSSQIQQSADAFLGALSSDEFQDPTSRISKRKEEQFAAFKNASNILDVITAAKPK